MIDLVTQRELDALLGDDIQIEESLLPQGELDSIRPDKITFDNAHIIAKYLVENEPDVAKAMRDELYWQLNQQKGAA